MFGNAFSGSGVMGQFAHTERVLSLQLSDGQPPLLLSAKFCSVAKTAAPKDRNLPSFKDIIGRTPSSVYTAVIRSTIGHRKLTMSVYSTGQAESTHMVKFTLPDNREAELPANLSDGVFDFDPTDPSYLLLLDWLSIKRWSNHLLIYHPASDTTHWQVGWNDYVFKSSSDRHKKLMDASSVETPGRFESRFCGSNPRLSYLQISFSPSGMGSGNLTIEYRKAYDFPWNRVAIVRPYTSLGASIRTDIMDNSLQQFLRVLTGKDFIEFIHLTMNFDRTRLYLNLYESDNQILNSC